MHPASNSMSLQRGVSLLGILFIAVLAILVGLVAIRTIPVAIEHSQVLKAAATATAGKTLPEVRDRFDKALQVEQITQITSRDIQVSREGDRMVVTFAYDRIVPLYGPAYLLFKLEGRSE